MSDPISTSSMLIAPDSPLRRIPVGLDRRQQIALDGIRIASDVLDLADRRLKETLLNLPALEQFSETYHNAVTSAISDAWSIVDNTHRFCELLRQFPQIKKNLLQFQILYRHAAPAEPLRHFIQHARNEIDSLAKSGLSIWGTLTWNLQADYYAGQKTTRALHMGTLYEGNFAVMGRCPESVEAEIDNVTLHAGPHAMTLTKVMRSVEQVIRGFERDISDQAGNLPCHMSDMLFSLTVSTVADDAPDSDETAPKGIA